MYLTHPGVACVATPLLVTRTALLYAFFVSPTWFPDISDDSYVYVTTHRLSSPTFGTTNATLVAVVDACSALEYRNSWTLLTTVVSIVGTSLVFCMACEQWRTHGYDLPRCVVVSDVLWPLCLLCVVTSVAAMFTGPRDFTVVLDARLASTPQITSIVVDGSGLSPGQIQSAVGSKASASLNRVLERSTNLALSFAVQGCVPLSLIPTVCSVMHDTERARCDVISAQVPCLSQATASANPMSTRFPNGIHVHGQGVTAKYATANAIGPSTLFPAAYRWEFYRDPQNVHRLFWALLGIDGFLYTSLLVAHVAVLRSSSSSSSSSTLTLDLG